MNKLPMTAAGHLALENELTHRIRVERPRLIQRIQEAIADDTNLAENSEYQAAKTEQERNEARIGELEDKLARAEIINVAKLSGDTIKFGATVTLIEEETGEKKIWQIVGEPEADARKGKISVVSPIARALIGKSRGETVEVEAPGGAKIYKIQRVEWLQGDLCRRGSAHGGKPEATKEKIAYARAAPFFPLLGEFARGGKPSITRVLASSRQTSPFAVKRSFR
jgi:transcription elongation factor GreA